MNKVASYTDAWIEIRKGLELGYMKHVASYTDAWIEIMCIVLSCSCYHVASYTDAWIEMCAISSNFLGLISRILHGCVD